MKNRPMFRTNRYVGIDINGDSLVAGRRNYPDALPMVADISNLSIKSCDFALCVQVLLRHNPANAATIVVRLTNLINPGGSLIFTISGPAHLSRSETIDAIVGYSFKSVKKVEYGMSFGLDQRLGPLLGALMFLFPFTRTLRGTKKMLYICKQKRGLNE